MLLYVGIILVVLCIVVLSEKDDDTIDQMSTDRKINALLLPDDALVITMTTIPERLSHTYFRQVIDRLLRFQPDQLFVNIPYRCRRNNELYSVPQWLHVMERRSLV